MTAQCKLFTKTKITLVTSPGLYDMVNCWGTG